MFQILKENPRAAIIALLMHLAIILFMIVGVDWLETPQPSRSAVEVVQARVVDQGRIDAEVEKLKRAEIERKAAIDSARTNEQKKLQDLKQKQEQEQKRLAELEKRRKVAEEQRLSEEKARRVLEKKKIAEEKRRIEAEKKRQAAEAEQKKAEQDKRNKAEAARKAEEKKRKQAEEKKRKQAEEAKRKAELEKKRQAEAARKAAEEKRRKAEAARKAREAELEAAMEAEHNARVTERYMLQIQQKINRNWVRLEGTGSGLKCTLRVRLAKGGNVIAVSVVKSSGNGAFDRSAEAAVYKAEPLPVPDDGLFDKFRDINFVFEPTR